MAVAGSGVAPSLGFLTDPSGRHESREGLRRTPVIGKGWDQPQATTRNRGRRRSREGSVNSAPRTISPFLEDGKGPEPAWLPIQTQSPDNKEAKAESWGPPRASGFVNRTTLWGGVGPRAWQPARVSRLGRTEG